MPVKFSDNSLNKQPMCKSCFCEKSFSTADLDIRILFPYLISISNGSQKSRKANVNNANQFHPPCITRNNNVSLYLYF